MQIDVAEASSHQPVALDKLYCFFVAGLERNRESGEQRQDLVSVLQVAAGKLADDERMAQHFIIFK